MHSTVSPAPKTALRKKEVCEQRVHTSPVVAMLAAMCVRKTGDTSTHLSLTQSGCTTTSKESFSTTRKKHKGFKIAVGRRSSNKEKETVSTVREEEKVVLPKIRDDEDGHLIYQKGDYLESRCKSQLLKTLCLYYYNECTIENVSSSFVWLGPNC